MNECTVYVNMWARWGGGAGLAHLRKRKGWFFLFSKVLFNYSYLAGLLGRIGGPSASNSAQRAFVLDLSAVQRFSS